MNFERSFWASWTISQVLYIVDVIIRNLEEILYSSKENNYDNNVESLMRFFSRLWPVWRKCIFHFRFWIAKLHFGDQNIFLQVCALIWNTNGCSGKFTHCGALIHIAVFRNKVLIAPEPRLRLFTTPFWIKQCG